MGDLQRANGNLCNENEDLKLEVQKGVEDMTKALCDGYNRCLARMATFGMETSGHSFDDFIKDFAKSMAAGDGGAASRDNGDS